VGSGFRVSRPKVAQPAEGFRVQVLGSGRVYGSEARENSIGYRVSGIGFGYRVSGSDLRNSGLGLRCYLCSGPVVADCVLEWCPAEPVDRVHLICVASGFKNLQGLDRNVSELG